MSSFKDSWFVLLAFFSSLFLLLTWNWDTMTGVLALILNFEDEAWWIPKQEED